MKENEFEDKIYAFGYKLSEHESAEIIEEIIEHIKVENVEKKYENKKILVGYNGVDGKEVIMSKLKENINEIRDSRSIYGGKLKNK